jgi:hypothetical protein
MSDGINHRAGMTPALNEKDFSVCTIFISF